MKKIFALLLVSGMAVMLACGPSAEEKAAAEKAKADSIAAAEKAKADSIQAAEEEAAAKEKAKQDSIAKADSIEAAKAKTSNTGGSTNTTPKKPTDKKKRPGGR